MKIQSILYIDKSFCDHWRIFRLPMLFHNSNAEKVIFFTKCRWYITYFHIKPLWIFLVKMEENLGGRHLPRHFDILQKFEWIHYHFKIVQDFEKFWCSPNCSRNENSDIWWNNITSVKSVLQTQQQPEKSVSEEQQLHCHWRWNIYILQILFLTLSWP